MGFQTFPSATVTSAVQLQGTNIDPNLGSGLSSGLALVWNGSVWHAATINSVTIEISGTPTTNQAILNFIPGTDIGITNPSGGNVQIAFTGQLAQTFTPVTHEFLTSYDASTGLFTAAQPAYSDLTGTPQLPITFGAVSHEFLTSYTSSTGLFTAAQPSFSDISGTVNNSQLTGSGQITINGTANHITTSGSPVALGGTMSVDLASPLNLPNLGAAILFNTDNAFDIGATGATRPANIWLGGKITMQQPTAATNIANHSSGTLEFDGTYWNGAASAVDDWTLQVVLGTGTNPTSQLQIAHSGSSSTVSITNIAGDGVLATYTAANNFSPGDTALIAGLTHTAFNGAYKIFAANSTIFKVFNATVQTSVADSGTANVGPFVSVPKLVSQGSVIAKTRILANQTSYVMALAISSIVSNSPTSGNVTATLTLTEILTAHQFLAGDTVVITGTTNFNGTYVIGSVTGTTITFPLVSSAATETSGTATDTTPQFDCSLNDSFMIQITANAVPNFFNFVQDQIVSIAIVQDSTGGHTWGWPSNVINAAAINPNSGVASVFSMLGGVDPANGGVKLYATNTTSSGGGSSPGRSTVNISGGSLNSVAPNARVTGSLTMAKSFLLQKVVATFPTRVRLYCTAASRDTTSPVNEPPRPVYVPPAPGTQHGVITDLYLDTSDKYTGWKLSPPAEGCNLDSPTTSTIYYSVTNLDTVTRNLSVTFTFVQEES